MLAGCIRANIAADAASSRRSPHTLKLSLFFLKQYPHAAFSHIRIHSRIHLSKPGGWTVGSGGMRHDKSFFVQYCFRNCWLLPEPLLLLIFLLWRFLYYRRSIGGGGYLRGYRLMTRESPRFPRVCDRPSMNYHTSDNAMRKSRNPQCYADRIHSALRCQSNGLRDT